MRIYEFQGNREPSKRSRRKITENFNVILNAYKAELVNQEVTFLDTTQLRYMSAVIFIILIIYETWKYKKLHVSVDTVIDYAHTLFFKCSLISLQKVPTIIICTYVEQLNESIY